jgi:hypothetical protein
MPLQATSGAASYDGFGGGVAVEPVYIEQIFSTYLYTGNGSTQTITNGIDLSGKGGLVWIKDRTNTRNNALWDTARGFGTGASSTTNKTLISNTTDAEGWASTADWASSPSATGFTVNQGGVIAATRTANASGDNYVSWTFRKQPKFFDVVTYTGNGTVKTVNHNLGSVPGCMIVKCTSAAGENWAVYHRSLGATKYIELNNTNAASTSVGSRWDAEPTSTSFSVGYNGSVNSNGETYVAYLFAHNAGGFGLTGTDNVISCGSYTGNGTTTGPDVNLGYEPQFLMVKNASAVGSWFMWDSMRGITADGAVQNLTANAANAETTSSSAMSINATGFSARSGVFSGSGSTYIYIAIRRGPMKVPTDATKVFAPVTMTGNETARNVPSGFVSDLYMEKDRTNAYTANALVVFDRLRGPNTYLKTNSTVAENFSSLGNGFDTMSGVNVGINGLNNGNGATYINYFMRRAPNTFDEVCYTGTGSPRTLAHNLTVPPELMIIKPRSGTGSWFVGNTFTDSNFQYAFLESTLSNQSQIYDYGGAGYYLFSRPDATGLYINGYSAVNGSGTTYVAYLFATCAGVSKCFNYTGNGSSQTINCGFTSGARWILIKRTDSTGDWYVWDSARGIVSGNDPHLSLNTTAAEVTSDDTIDTDSTGFVVNQVSATNVNVSSATYIGIAIA